ncbi:hypothetical protein QQF64_012516 [Cirrhinus molitorella]|uniref:Uncharacterized protein n=1 Tax=Cirrhinus molitorella TaxID=172907 RepID=A0ABR3LVR1_9TELE
MASYKCLINKGGEESKRQKRGLPRQDPPPPRFHNSLDQRPRQSDVEVHACRSRGSTHRLFPDRDIHRNEQSSEYPNHFHHATQDRQKQKEIEQARLYLSYKAKTFILYP